MSRLFAEPNVFRYSLHRLVGNPRQQGPGVTVTMYPTHLESERTAHGLSRIGAHIAVSEYDAHAG